MSATRSHDEIEFLEPWARVSQYVSSLEKELRKETTAGHVLFSLTSRAVARRADNDDVLFEVDSTDFRYAVVHLSWSKAPERDPRWPDTETFATIEDWIENRMKPDHARYLNQNEHDDVP